MDAIERENVGEREGTSILENLRKFPECIKSFQERM